MSKGSSQVFFPGLNGLRFYAASAVIFHHCEQFKFWEGIPGIWGKGGLIGTFIDSLGHQAVGLFFVLSGYLITYLLLVEIEKTGDISFKKFYIRRTLRIWPVYYLVLIVAFFVIPHITNIDGWNEKLNASFGVSLIFYLLILPNVLRGGSVQVVGANQAWSVGVEEQFYIIWPLLVKLFHKHFLKFIVVFVSIKLMIQAGLQYGVNLTTDQQLQTYILRIYYIWKLLAIEQMAIGAFGAWLLFKHKDRWIKFFYTPLAQIIALLIFISLFTIELEYFGKSIVAAFSFLVIIINISTNEKTAIKLNHSRYDILGNMSYGIYMYHTIAIALVMTVLKKMNMTENLLTFNLLLFISSFILTMILSYLSYTYFESFFLTLKKKFMVIISSSKS